MYKTLLNIISNLPFSYFFAKRLLRGKFFVFNYHNISNQPSQFCIDYNLNVTPDVFDHQLEVIKKNFHVYSPLNINENKFSSTSALITFDDGFDDSFSLGGNILKKHKVPAIYFINMGVVYGEIFWSGLICYLIKYEPKFKKYCQENLKLKISDEFFLFCTTSHINDFFSTILRSDIENKARKYYGEFIKPERLRNLNNQFIFLGNHLYNHFNAANISEESLINSYEKNFKILKKYSSHTLMFSYPFGQIYTCYNEDTHATIKKLGASKIFIATPGYNANIDSLIYSRISMYNYIQSEKKLIVHCILQPLIYNNSIYRIYKYLKYKYGLNYNINRV
jgi:peptidoglycan/xylan/chitin deacetylase (PgdA/CDA1 family)